MKYILLIYGAEDSWNEDERRDCMIESKVVIDDLKARGKYLGASPLQPVATANSVRVRDGRVLVTDGPFAETTEQLGGYFLLDLADLDEAIAVAARVPPAARGAAEIRPIAALEGLPQDRPLPDDWGVGLRTPFLLLCYDDEDAWESAGPEALAQARAEAAGLARWLSDEDRYLGAAPLHPASTATCVRVRDGRRIITDGPFAETREVLGGFYLILAEDRDTAVRIAAEHPGAGRDRRGPTAVRPVRRQGIALNPPAVSHGFSASSASGSSGNTDGRPRPRSRGRARRHGPSPRPPGRWSGRPGRGRRRVRCRGTW